MRGAKAHDFEFLRHLYRSLGGAIPGGLTLHFHAVREWRTDWRYESPIVEFEEGESFLASAAEIRSWAERSV